MQNVTDPIKPDHDQRDPTRPDIHGHIRSNLIIHEIVRLASTQYILKPIRRAGTKYPNTAERMFQLTKIPEVFSFEKCS